MTLQQLTYIKMTAECGNITEAAEKLFISQPSLSAAIHNLEKEMGVTIFVRSKKGVVLTREGEELLSYAGMLLEQVDIMKEHFGVGKARMPKFSVSCQHYSFAVNAFVDVVQTYDAAKYDLSSGKHRPVRSLMMWRQAKASWVCCICPRATKPCSPSCCAKVKLVFEELFTAAPHVFINKDHPLADRKCITLDELKPYPYLIFEQGDRNSFYFSEELLSMLDMPKTIQVRDRATLFSLVIGLNGFTVSSGIIDRKLNSPSIIARPLEMEGSMRIGLIRKKNVVFSRYADSYVKALKKHLSID